MLDNPNPGDARIDGKNFAQEWAPDGLGNWSTFKNYAHGGNTPDLDQDRTPNGANEIQSIIGGGWAAPAYDKAGNLISGPQAGQEATRLHYIYDPWNRLVEVKTDDGGEPDITLTQYRYDGLGRLIVRGENTDASGDLDTFTHYFCAGPQVIETRDASSLATDPETLAPHYQYVWSARGIDVPILRDTVDDSTGQPISTDRLYYLTDANNNVTALMRPNGTVAERYVYDPFGKVTVYNPDWTGSSTADIGNTILFAGRDFDPTTGLYYNRARWYHPTLGRFMGRDPLGFSAGDADLYRYCGNNPISLSDPSGLIVQAPNGLLNGDANECSFAGFDARNQAVDVTVPIWGGSPVVVHVPQGGRLTPLTFDCAICGPCVIGYQLYDPGPPECTTTIGGTGHYHLIPDYMPGPNWFEDFLARGGGLIQAAWGVVEASTGAILAGASAPTPAAPVAVVGGLVLVVHGFDNTIAGLQTFLTGRYHYTITSDAITQATGSRMIGEGGNMLIGVIGTGKANAIINGGKAVTPNVTPAQQAAQARDALGRDLGREHAAYGGGTKDGQIATGRSSNPTGCAEDDVARQLGPSAKFTKT